MSNAEKMVMVMVPRELIERIAQACMFTMFKEDYRAIREILDQPAEQGQGEPVVLPTRHVHEHHGCFLSERQHGWNACLDEIEKLGPLYTHPAPVQGEPVAHVYTMEALLTPGSAVRHHVQLYRELPSGTKLYTHADPAEVERLRHDIASYLETMAKTCDLLGIDIEAAKTAEGKPSDVLFKHAQELRGEVERLRKELLEWKDRSQRNTDKSMEWMAKYDSLRAQLAERDSLIYTMRKELHALVPDGYTDPDKHPLSASAETNAPVEHLQAHDCGGVWPAKDFIEADGCPKCGPEAPIERDDLVKLLREMTSAYRSTVQAGYDRITSLGGDCDSVDKMLADFPAYAKARAALEHKP